MKVTYRKVNFGSDDDCTLLAKWANDPEIRHFSTRYQNEASFAAQVSPERFKERLSRARPNRTDLMILLDGEPVGYANYELFPELEESTNLSVAWLAIVLGEARARGKGLGRIVMTHIETLARAAGAVRAEIGVFEFNERALALYRKLGYCEFKQNIEFTYWNGRMWTDIRMAKGLVALVSDERFRGMIVEESLFDNRVLNGLNFVNVQITTADRPGDRWHIYTIDVTKSDIERLHAGLIPGRWYMHFWNADKLIVVYRDQLFELKASDRDAWLPAINYGLALGIPREQLDFVMT